MIHTGSAQPTWEDHGRKQQSCPWARPRVAPRKEQPHLHSPFPGGWGEGGGEAQGCLQPARACPPLRKVQQQTQNQKCKSACLCQSCPKPRPNQTKPRGQVPLSPGVPCPGKLRNHRGRKALRVPSILGLRCQSQTSVLIPVGSLSSCATLAEPPSLRETQSRDIIPDHKSGPSDLAQEKHLVKWWLLSV